jgi:hypothetical protein
MRFQTLIFCTILTFSILLTGCPADEQPKANTNAPANQTTGGNSNAANSTLSTSKTPTEATTNDAPTVAPVFKAYCDAMTKKDEAALRKIYSQGTLRAHEADMKAENEKSLVKYLEADRVSNKGKDAMVRRGGDHPIDAPHNRFSASRGKDLVE